MRSVLLASLGVLAGVVGLWAGARLLVESAAAIARRLGVSEAAIGLTVVAVGTSLPELVVTVDAALSGYPNVAVGNVVGANAFNATFVLGVTALVVPLGVTRASAGRNAALLAVGAGVPALVLLDGSVSQFEGVVLCLAWLASLPAFARIEHPVEPDVETEPVTRWTVAALVAGTALVLASGDLLVQSATSLAAAAGVSTWVVGTTIVAAGTSTPELATNVLAARRGRVGIAVGNVVGSNVFRPTGVLGAAALAGPIAPTASVAPQLWWLAGASLLAALALLTRRTLGRREGAVLVLAEAARWVVVA
ncbi:sodium:calcium antiporter [Halobacterium litoreum]|uniref:Sodium:calcium antiporter n=1 Tax=Halobacterium litoreum TaxID=2039234 RepID=A0ABD5NFK3_9EURY|nr:sodium:calcium antiporter [Halobacterium litoreum]UHH13153.1 sodium:calcium antiporter [Halobacterium litoreum]